MVSHTVAHWHWHCTIDVCIWPFDQHWQEQNTSTAFLSFSFLYASCVHIQ